MRLGGLELGGLLLETLLERGPGAADSVELSVEGLELDDARLGGLQAHAGRVEALLEGADRAARLLQIAG